MLESWLHPLPATSFVRDYLRKQPYAAPSTARNAVSIFGWQTLERLLTVNPPADILVVARGKLFESGTPRTLTETRELMAHGAGLVIRRAEQHDPGIAKLAASITDTLPGDAHVQLFVTPGGTHGFGWHYDDEEVFIVQTHGTKDYFFRDNTVERGRPPDRAPDFGRFRDETSLIGSTRLIAGDWLYIPSRWWHVAKCVEDSLSMSIGVAVHPSRAPHHAAENPDRAKR